MPNYLLLDSTNVVTLSQLKNEVDGVYVADATATLDLLTAAGAPVTGAQGIAMDIEAGTTARQTKYRGVIPADVALVEGAAYDARVTAVATDGSERTFYLSCTAAKG